MVKRLIYTVCTNNYDKVDPPRILKGFDYWLFTDNPDLKVNGYQIKLVQPESDPIKLQRKIKILSHLYTKGYDITIYHDANISIRSNPLSIFKGGIMASKHHSRNNILDEAKQIIKLGKDTEESCNRTLEFAKKIGYEDNLGLWETGILVRDKSKEVIEIEQHWFNILSKHSHRDQLSLPISCYLSNCKIYGVPRQYMYHFFTLPKAHLPKLLIKKEAINIWYSNPFRSDLNIGRAINNFCNLIKNPEDWIVLQDGDITYLTSDWGKRIESALLLDGSKFGLVGCYTNRIKEAMQCHQRQFSNDSDIRNHMKIAQSYQGQGIQEINHGIAGFFMAFQKKTFDLVGGFAENTIAFDTDFNKKVRAKGLKLGLIRSLYVWHSYRLLSDNPWDANAIKHLVKR